MLGDSTSVRRTSGRVHLAVEIAGGRRCPVLTASADRIGQPLPSPGLAVVPMDLADGDPLMKRASGRVWELVTTHSRRRLSCTVTLV
jgi:hypothetical protein